MPTSRVQSAIRFEAELLAKITYIAKRNKRSLNGQLEFLAQECVEKYEKEVEEIPVSDDDLYNR